MAGENENTEGKKYFNPKDYNTMFVSTQGQFEPNEDRITVLVNLLTDPANKSLRHDVLGMLRSNAATATTLIVEALQDPLSEGKRDSLTAACWEADLNCSNHLVFFTGLMIEEDYLVALEAATVIENMQGPFVKEQVNESIRMVNDYLGSNSTEKTSLLNEILPTIESFLPS